MKERAEPGSDGRRAYPGCSALASPLGQNQSQRHRSLLHRSRTSRRKPSRRRKSRGLET